METSGWQQQALKAGQLVAAAGLLLRLGGFGRDWLPSAGGCLATLLLLLGVAWIRRPAPSGEPGRPFQGAVVWLRTHWFAAGLAALAALALAIRVFGITAGLGHVPLGVDENRLNTSVLYFLRSGDIDYTTVEHYPGIHFWLLAGSYVLAFLRGLLADLGTNLGNMPRETFVAAGRMVSTAQGVATVAITGFIGRRLVGPGVGLLAAGLIALSPLSITLSRQLRNDAAAVLLIAAAALAALRLYDRGGDDRDALFAGVLAGLATAVKYTGVFVFIPVMMGAATQENSQRRGRSLAFAAIGFVGAVAVSNHFVWADVPNFLRQLADQVGIMGEEHWAAQDNPAMFHARIMSFRIVGWPMLVLATAVAAYRLAFGTWRWWLFLSFPLVYLWFASQQPSQLPRWVYPSAPFVAVAASAGLVAVISFLADRLPATSFRSARLRVAMAAAIAFLFISPIALESARLLARQLSTPTYGLAEQWLDEQGANGDRVLIQRGWLALDDEKFEINAARDLDEILNGGLYQLAENDWVVVHEPLMGRSSLGRLALVETFLLDPSFTGNHGPDFAVYRPRPVRALQGTLDVVFKTTEARRYLGIGWPRGGSSLPGLGLPVEGASIFLPPIGGSPIRLEILVVADSAASGDPGLTAESRGTTLALNSTEQDDSVLVFSTELSVRTVGPGICRITLRPSADAGELRVLGFRIG